MIVLDLCRKTFKKVICFMYLVPGLEHIERQLQFAREIWSEILQYPHWLLSRLLKNGIYCNNHHCFDNLPIIPNDIYSLFDMRQHKSYQQLARRDQIIFFVAGIC